MPLEKEIIINICKKILDSEFKKCRYNMFLLNIHRLIKGAKQAGLDPDYIEKLSNQPTYKPNDAVLKVEGANKEFWSSEQFLQWGHSH